MKYGILRLTVLCFCLFALRATATTYYVDINSPNPTPPYTSWTTAATNIQDAIAQTVNGDLILVNPGVYQPGGYAAPDGTFTAVDVTNAITIQSVDGQSATWINGRNARRCIFLADGAALTGFTLTNGEAINGGGVYCASTNAIVSNCLFTGNTATSAGGGAYLGTLVACTLAGNSCPTETGVTTYGGGAYEGTLINCTVLGNQAFDGGGVANALVFRSLIISNVASYPLNPSLSYGGGTYNSEIFSSALAENSAGDEGGGAYNGILVNCTVTENSAQEGGGVANCSATNCIIFYNNISSDFPGATNWNGEFTLNYCCTLPAASGTGNNTNAPILASISHISLDSPCVGAGNPSVANGVDIDGTPWANPPSIGCSEIYPGNNTGAVTAAISTPFTNQPPGYPINFLALINGPVYNSVWNFGDGTLVTNQPYISHTWTSPGTYPVTLTAYNDSYPAGVAATLTMTIAVPTVYYVDLSDQNPVPPYSHWSTAATNIEDAVSIAVPGSLVLVTNSAYNLQLRQTNGIAIYQYGSVAFGPPVFNRVAITNPITVQSVNGPSLTYIQGASSVRCVYMTNGAVLSGFTITGGEAPTYGGGIYAVSTNCMITNCIITRSGAPDGGGVYSGTLDNCRIWNNQNNSGGVGAGVDMSVLNGCLVYSNSTFGSGAGAAYSTLNDCTLSNNTCLSGGLGPAAFECVLSNCNLSDNSAQEGGAMVGGIANNCFFTSNTAVEYGGAVYGTASYPIVLNNCTLSNNVAVEDSGGAAYGQTAPNFTNCILNNCFLTSNHCYDYGGAAYAVQMNNCVISNNWLTASDGSGGGVEGGLLNNCLIVGNQAIDSGGVDTERVNATLNNCTLANNAALGAGAGGGAGNAFGSCILNQCILSNNVAGVGGGAYGCVLSQCLVLDNVATNEYGTGAEGGGVAYSALNGCLIISNTASAQYEQFEIAYGGGAYSCELTNCILADNVSLTNGGGAYQSTLVNCTVVANSANFGGGTLDCTNDNSILYYNNGGDYYPATAEYPLNYCCTPVPATNGVRNIANAPLFVSLGGGDFHLQSLSPCINSGNNAYITAPADLDGNPRIVGGTVDIGAYEYQTPTSVISYAYLQQYGLPTDGSVDFKDLDGTGFDVYQDWIAGLNPTNPASVLAMLTPVTTNTATGVTVTWQSASGIPYLLQRSTNLASEPPFSTIQNNIIGQTNTTSYTDTSATNKLPYFYRVGVTAP